MLKNEAYWVTAKFRKLHAKGVLQEIYGELHMKSTELYQKELKEEMVKVCQGLKPTRILDAKCITQIAKAKQAKQPLDEIKMEFTDVTPPSTFGPPFPQDIENACEKMGQKIFGVQESHVILALKPMKTNS